MQLDHLNEIRSLFEELSASRQEYDFQPAALASHAEHYATQPDRLRYYAKQVISGRIMTLFASSRMSTQALLNTYLLGVDATSPLPMLLAARSQLELFSVVADVTRVIIENSGEHPENFSRTPIMSIRRTVPRRKRAQMAPSPSSLAGATARSLITCRLRKGGTTRCDSFSQDTKSSTAH